MSRVDAVVVGAGAMGSAAAWWLARRGRSVVVLERFERGHIRGASHGSSRIFRLAYPVPDYVRLARDALALWRELEDDAGADLVTITGGLDHGDPRTVSQVAEALARCDVACEILEPESAAERWPGMRFDRTVLHQREGGRIDADATVRALQDRAAHHGAEVLFEAPVRAIGVRGDEAVVRTDDAEWQAPAVVVACGAWTSSVVGNLVRLPRLEVTREQVFHFRPLDGTDWPSFIHHADTFIYGLHSPGEGVKVAEHHTGPLVDPDRRDFEVDDTGRARLRRYVEEWLPGLDPEPVLPTTCLYTTTPTEDFVLDRRGAIVIGAGFSGHGFKFTPLIGRILADLAEGRPGLGPRFSLPA